MHKKMCSRLSAMLGLGLGLGINARIIYLVAVSDKAQNHIGNSNHHSLSEEQITHLPEPYPRLVMPSYGPRVAVRVRVRDKVSIFRVNVSAGVKVRIMVRGTRNTLLKQSITTCLNHVQGW